MARVRCASAQQDAPVSRSRRSGRRSLSNRRMARVRPHPSIERRPLLRPRPARTTGPVELLTTSPARHRAEASSPSVQPGVCGPFLSATAFTRIPRIAYSSTAALVRPETPCLVATLPTATPEPTCPTTEPLFTMAARCRLTISGISYFMHSHTLVRFVDRRVANLPGSFRRHRQSTLRNRHFGRLGLLGTVTARRRFPRPRQTGSKSPACPRLGC